MTTILHTDSVLSPPLKWSIYAGFYMFGCATVTVFFLNDILGLLANVIGIPAQYAIVVLASPALLIGTVTWWGIVEWRFVHVSPWRGIRSNYCSGHGASVDCPICERLGIQDGGGSDSYRLCSPYDWSRCDCGYPHWIPTDVCSASPP